MKWGTYEFARNKSRRDKCFAPLEVVGVTALFWILFTLATICLLSITLVVVVVWLIVRGIRRSRAVHGAVLRTRTRFSWGQHRKLLSLRLLLAESVDSGRAAIDLAVGSDGRRGELPRLFRRIESEALSLDSQLRLLESETDSGVLAAEIPAIGLRVSQLAGTIRRLRASVSTGLGAPSEETLVELRTDVDREVAALRAGQAELRRLNGQRA